MRSKSQTSEILPRYIRKIGALHLGRKLRIHTIAFGALRGRKIFLSFEISPRIWFRIDEPSIAKVAQINIQQSDVIFDIRAYVGYS